MSRQKTFLPLIIILIALLACGLPGNIRPSITPAGMAVEAIPTRTSTLESINPTETIPPIATSTVGVQFGDIRGRVNYPSEFIAPQRVVVYLANDFTTYFTVDTALNQSAFRIQVPEGMYYVVSYLIEGDLSAGYSAAVTCGLTVDCTDHSLLPVIVSAGQITDNIDVYDWYAPQGAYPPKP